MAEGWIAAAANSALDTLLAAHTWIKQHTGAPGAAATSNAATETTRKQATWGSASGGAATNTTSALTWTAVAGSEDYTHFSAWTASSAGTPGFTGTVTANAVTAGDTFTIAIGDLDVSVPVAS